MVLNISAIKTSSDGAWQGDNPLNYAFPLLIIQTTLVLLVSRTLTLLLKPLRQPKVIAEILGGILLGPSAIGRNKYFLHTVFPSWSTPILESVASIGLLFFLFLVGLELDLRTIRRSSKQAFGIAIAGISLPFIFALGVTFFLQRAIHFENHNVGYLKHLIFIGVSLSITAFPVLARILAELKLLTTRVGETAMAAAAFNDLAAWILLALAVALAGGEHKSSPFTSIFVLLSGVAFVAFMLILVRPMMNWLAHQNSRENESLDEAHICITLAGVMLSGFVTDLIGIHSIFGAFVFGLMIPKGGEFASRVTTRIEDFVSTLLLPLYFASSGLKTDVTKLQGVEEWELLLLVISTACVGKILGTFVVATMSTIPAKESLALGVLMNTKGLVELIVLNIGKEKKVLNDEMFTILVLMALFTTFITTPTLLAIYKPARAINSSHPHRHRQLSQKRPPPLTNLQEELRILACIHGTSNVPSLINFIESIRVHNSKLKLYIMQLVEHTDRSSSILMIQRHRKNGFPFINRFQRGGALMHDQIATALIKGNHGVAGGKVTVHHLKAISAMSTMHEDICHVAEKKSVAMIILPFHKRWRSGDEGAVIVSSMGQSWREVNQRVLQNAPCSVGVLVDHGFAGRNKSNLGAEYQSSTHVNAAAAAQKKKVCIIFIGGLDDRKVLELGGRMAEQPTLRLTLVRFMSYNKQARNKGTSNKSSIYDANNSETQMELDEVAVNKFKTKWHGSVEYIEKDASNLTEEILTIGKENEYELVIVGKGQLLLESTMVANIKDSSPEHAELGSIGDLLTSPNKGITSSLLVIQDETTLKEMGEASSIMNNDAISEIESSV